MTKTWWKVIACILILYSVIGGFLFPVPALPILHETVRNLYFHVPMWFAMIMLYLISVIYSIKYLNKGQTNDDLIAVESVNAGVIFCFFGLISGSLWANITWGDPWPNDPKLNGSAIATLMYLAYLVLRNAIDEEQKRAKISAIYNVFAFPVMIVLIYILPKLTDSLHPGSGGNAAFSDIDMDNRLRMVFYPACLGWILMGVWIMTIRYRILLIENKQNSIN
jgi:heme exporter protein C